jgi:hypothetical protein
MVITKVCLGLNVQVRQLKNVIGNINNLGQHIYNFHVFMHVAKYIGWLLSLFWLSCIFSNKAKFGVNYPKSYHINIMVRIIGKN